MKHYYSTVNNVVMTFDDIEDKVYYDQIPVRFERANENGFDFAEINIPQYSYTKSFGFSEDELMKFKRYLVNNSSLIWELAKDGNAHA